MMNSYGLLYRKMRETLGGILHDTVLRIIPVVAVIRIRVVLMVRLDPPIIGDSVEDQIYEEYE